MTRLRSFAGLTLIALGVSSAAYAAPAVGLKGEKTLVRFDTDKPADMKTIEVTGVDTLIGIDLRPSTADADNVSGALPASRADPPSPGDAPAR